MLWKDEEKREGQELKVQPQEASVNITGGLTRGYHFLKNVMQLWHIFLFLSMLPFIFRPGAAMMRAALLPSEGV